MRTNMGEVNYDTLKTVSDIISSANELTDVAPHVVNQLTEAFSLKGCALLLLNRRTQELEVAASHGLSPAYLAKGPISATRSIAESLHDGPVAVYNVEDDPRLQYPIEAVREGIRSILSVPLVLRGKPLGNLRLYTGQPWEFTMQDLIFFQAIAQFIALTMENIRITNACKTSIEVLKYMRPVTRPMKRTLYE